MRAFDAAFIADWAMQEEALMRLLAIAARDHMPTPEALEAYKAQTLENAERAKIRDRIAILDVRGPLFKRANMMTAISGATSYDVLRRDLQVALDDDTIHSLVLNIDSPGGEASGVGELASAIYQARTQKKIVAYIGDLGASAAYWIASAADEIVIGESAALGSIGVRAAYSEPSQQEDQNGNKTYDFVSSQSPFKRADPTSKDGRERIQARVDRLADIFITNVAKYRNIDREKVLTDFGRGDVVIGQTAVDLGMANRLGSFENLLASLAGRNTPFALGGGMRSASGTNGESKMTEAKSETSNHEDLAQMMAQTESLQKDAFAKGVLEERGRISALLQLTLPGFEHKRDEAIQSGLSAAEFSAFVIAETKSRMKDHQTGLRMDIAANSEIKVKSMSAETDNAKSLVARINQSYAMVHGTN